MQCLRALIISRTELPLLHLKIPNEFIVTWQQQNQNAVSSPDQSLLSVSVPCSVIS